MEQIFHGGNLYVIVGHINFFCSKYIAYDKACQGNKILFLLFYFSYFKTQNLSYFLFFYFVVPKKVNRPIVEVLATRGLFLITVAMVTVAVVMDMPGSAGSALFALVLPFVVVCSKLDAMPLK